MSFKKSGTVNCTSFSNTALLEDMELKTLSDKSVWAKIFEHNNKAGTVLFTTIDEVLNVQVANKYSRLYLINSFKATDGKLELMLEYPDDLAGKYNRWKQTKAPQEEFIAETSTGDGKVTGYEAVHIDWTANFWGGIARQSSAVDTYNSTYLDGSVGHGNWYYAIGAKSVYSGGIPGPSTAVLNRAQLWVRIDTLPEVQKLKISKVGSILSNDIYEL